MDRVKMVIHHNQHVLTYVYLDKIYWISVPKMKLMIVTTPPIRDTDVFFEGRL